MKLINELQEGLHDGLEQLHEFMQLAKESNWAEAINILEQHSASIVSVYLSRLRADLGGAALQEILNHWKAQAGITERRILTNVHLSDYQKKVLAKTQAADDEHDAYSDISVGDINLIAARDTLAKIGLIDVDPNQETAFITPQGLETMKAENLVDDMGQLTDDGQQYVYDDDADQQEPQPGAAPGAPPPGQMGQQDMGGQPGGMGGEQQPDLDMGPMESVLRETAGSGLTQEEHRDIRAFVEGTMEWYDMIETAQEKLYGVWVSEMPYGTAKGRTGDPDEWISDKMRGDVGDLDNGANGLRFAKRTYRDRIDDYIKDLFK